MFSINIIPVAGVRREEGSSPGRAKMAGGYKRKRYMARNAGMIRKKRRGVRTIGEN